MILIGQYDSPFVRRVGIALTLYNLPFRQEPWSVFGDADRIRPFNPLTRVPTLVLPDGDSLIDSHMILDHLDSLVPAALRLFPQTEPDRRRALKRAALACGVGDKAVSLFYELRLHEQTSAVFVDRCRRQISEGLQVLEAAQTHGPDGHAEIAIACVWRFATEAHPGLIASADFPQLSALSTRLEATAPFRTIFQPFVAPA
ncbi:MAG TPA: glutathione S-transferase N-terminal domain-containing protein [Paracoccaceae bacterium]|nr:glutathione S-transferase N-terminal domain-containing protein [Paracoccaceae bacterium]